MRKKTRALSGASQDAYFRHVLKAFPSISPQERDGLVRRLREEVAQLRVRKVARGDDMVAATAPSPVTAPIAAISEPPLPAAEPASEPPPVPAAEFDPYSPNVIVVVRRSGRDAALAALGAIDNLDDLRRLAREQRLAVSADVSSAAELRSAIVAAAERRIANRMAAAG
jgi:hypothetical protein